MTVAFTLPSLAVVVAAQLKVHLSLVLLWPLVMAVILVGVTGAYLSVRQSAWLDRFVRRELEAVDRA